MPKSDNTLILQCSFINSQTGKKCLNQSENRFYCTLHLKSDLNKNVDINNQQTNLEERTNYLIERIKRLQNNQLCKHINRQLSAFVKYQQDQLNITCQHPQFINRDHFLFDKNLVLSTLQSQTNISQEDKSKLLSQNYFKNLPTSQLVKLVKKLEQNNNQNQSNNQQPQIQFQQQQQQQSHPQQQLNCLQNNQQQNCLNNQNNQQQKNVNSELKQQLLNNTNNASTLNSLKEELNQAILKDENNKNRKSSLANNNSTALSSSSLSSTTNKLTNIVVNRKPLAPKFTSDQIKQINSTTGILRTNLRHFENSYDSDATESSSGGESCDELDDYLNDLCKQQKLDFNSITPLPLNQKPSWKWALERGSIASRYTWLQAQVADLDFKIRQQNELYKQFRASKGQISFYSNELNSNDNDKDELSLEEEVTSSCVRTLPLKEMKKRKQLVRSAFTLTNNARKPTVLCSCSSLPAFANSCVLCNERYNYIQAIDTDCMPITERVALLDASYHNVLSLSENVSLGLHFSKLLKKETVHRPILRSTISKKKKIGPKGELGLKFKSELSKKKKSQALIQSTKLKKKYEGNNKKQLLNKKATKVRLKSKMSKMNSRNDNLNYADENTRHDSPIPHFGNENSNLINSSFIRRRRSEQNAFDINNIVIPYSIASTTRVEKLQYKEIITPKWRVTEGIEELNENMEIDLKLHSNNNKYLEELEEDLKDLVEEEKEDNNKIPLLDKPSPSLSSSSSTAAVTPLNKPPPVKSSSLSTLNILLNKSLDKMETNESSSLNNSPSIEVNQLDSISNLIKNNNEKKEIKKEPENESENENKTSNNSNNSNNNVVKREEDEDSNLSESTDVSERKSDSLEDLSDEIFIERHLKCE